MARAKAADHDHDDAPPAKPKAPAKSATKSVESKSTALPKRGHTKQLWLMLAALATIGGSYALWKQIEPAIFGSEHYTFTRQQLILTPSPTWVHADIKAEAFKQSSIEEPMSALDRGLAERLSKAFTMHAWVSRVVLVKLLTTPPGAQIDLEYRRPVCMVEVPGGLFPIDEFGVLLPTADFSMEDAKAYPRLSGVPAATAGPVGTPWQDAQVVAAARIAATLAPNWRTLKLERIVPLTGSTPADPQFELRTGRGTRVVWGHAEPPAGSNESKLADKLAKLSRYATPAEGLDRATPEELDVRTGSGLIALPATH